jgi:predicted nuclease with TOPRIM domain
MLIYTAQLALQVDQEAFSVTIDRVVDIAVGFGGYIATSDNSSVQVRVPSAGFRDALKQMEKLGLVTNRAVQVQDVSEEFADLEVKLKSLRATRDRLEQFLARAKDIQEVLNVERELSRLNGEIDRIEGRMRFLSSRAAFSTITVSLQPKPKQVIIPKTDEPPPPPPRTIPLPIPWLGAVGIDRLLQLSY